MANAILWQAALASRGTVLTTQLNSLAASGQSVVGTEIDNSTNLDIYGWFEIGHGVTGGVSAVGDTIEIWMDRCYDGTTYEDGEGVLVVVVPIDVTGADLLHVYMSQRFRLPPCKVKFTLKNICVRAMMASTNYVELFTSNLEVQ